MIWKLLKGARKKRVPLSTAEIIRRGMRSEEIIQWSGKKSFTIFNPPFWGIHQAFIDKDLAHAVICLKEDRSAYVFLGNTAGALRWASYDPQQRITEENALQEGELSWNFYEDYVIYRGSLLPPTSDPYYWGKVIGQNPFEETITPSWIIEQIRKIIAQNS